MELTQAAWSETGLSRTRPLRGGREGEGGKRVPGKKNPPSPFPTLFVVRSGQFVFACRCFCFCPVQVSCFLMLLFFLRFWCVDGMRVTSVGRSGWLGVCREVMTGTSVWFPLLWLLQRCCCLRHRIMQSSCSK